MNKLIGDMTEQEWGEAAFANHQDIVNAVRMGKRSCAVLGRLFYENKKYKLYDKMGYKSVEEYAESPEVDMSRATVYGLSEVYERYVLQLGVSEEDVAMAGVKKLRLLTGKVNKSNVGEWVAKAQTLSYRDLQKEMRGQGDSEPNFPVLDDGYYALRKIDDPAGEVYLGRQLVTVIRTDVGVILKVG
jgi:hypothetical protein